MRVTLSTVTEDCDEENALQVVSFRSTLTFTCQQTPCMTNLSCIEYAENALKMMRMMIVAESVSHTLSGPPFTRTPRMQLYIH